MYNNNDSYLACNAMLHYFVKFEDSKMLAIWTAYTHR